MLKLLQKRKLETQTYLPAIGTYSSGEPLTVDPQRLGHWLISGATGGGKSSYINSLLNVLQHEEYQFFGIDCKEGLELLPWSSLFDEISCSPSDSTETIAKVNDICAQRLKQLKTERLRMWPEKDRVLLLVDELAECLTLDLDLPDKQAKAELRQRQAGLVTLARLGRAVGVYVVGASQTGYVDSVPAALKANLGVRVACKVSTVELLKSSLGSAYGFQPEDVPPYPGAALVLGLPDCVTQPRLARAFWVET